jgi:hypothetical protein
MRNLILVVACLSCAHDPPPRAWTRESGLAMAPSHRCKGQRCVCREAGSADDAAEQTPPPAGQKRYELRIGPTADLVWIEVAGRGVYFKETETGGGACAYVDLPIGQKAHLVYHVESQERTRGTALDLRISEHNPKLGAWYDTATIECGGGGAPCDRALLGGWLDRMHGLPRGLQDACGSTKLLEPRWSTPETDLPHPPTITVELDLEVFKFEPRSPPGAPDCGKRHKDNE